MSYFLEPFKNWFGYDRKERRASFLLLILILIVISVRLSYPDNKTEIIDMTSGFNLSSKPHESGISSDTLSDEVRNDVRQTHANSKKLKVIELNSCDSAILERLPGIGPVLSARIIKYRNLLGGFVSVDQLKEVYGLPPETFERIKGQIDVDQSGIRKTNINTAGSNDLAHIPYLKRYHLAAIVKYRDIIDSITGFEELVENKIITDSLARKISPYVIF